MGWFWATPAPKIDLPIAPHPVSSPGARPPPACPAHKPDGQPAVFPPRLDKAPESTASSCPVKSPSHPLKFPTSTPSMSPGQTSETQSSLKPSSTASTLSKLNPLNYMPTLQNTRLEDSPQSMHLPLEREVSTIPRGDSEQNWEYPSPQQMYNAMLRKGYTDTDTGAVESMVAVHNFLNEGAWEEIVGWEQVFSQGLSYGWSLCRQGEEGIARERAKEEFLQQRRLAMERRDEDSKRTSINHDNKPKLLRFMGRPGEPTPKARILTILGQWFPNSFGSEPPFDRHDWYVLRKTPDGRTREVRYVIDYYGGGIQETGEPVFYLDIRPALDSPTAAIERTMRWGGDVWYRASGGAARQKP